MDIDRLTATLAAPDAEGWRAVIYDDGTGKPITKGTIVRGVPTLGAGLTGPFTRDELMPITRSRAQAYWETLEKALPWVSDLNEPRQQALGEMAYNLGVTDLLKFNTFLGLMQAGQYDAAADDLGQTLWAKQVGVRAARICALIKGEMQV